LEDDRKRIEDYLKAKGYYLAKVYPAETKKQNDKIKILFKINEGNQIKIKNIFLQVEDNILYDKAIEILGSFKENIFNDSILIDIKRKITEIYQKNGYIDPIVSINYELKENNVEIYISIKPGKKRFFGKSIILGNKKTKTKFIYDRLIPKDKASYNPYILEEERQMLYKTGLFSRVDIYTQRLGESIDVIYMLDETPAGAIEFGLGYGEYEKVKGFIELSYINFLGTNKQIFSRIELSTLEKRSYLTYVDPWLWKDLIFKSTIGYEDLEFKSIDTKKLLYKIKKLGFSVGLEKKLSEKFKIELLYEGAYSKTSNVLPEIVISDVDVGKLFISGFRGSVIYDTRDNPFDPQKGWLAGMSSKISLDAIGSEINFSKTSFYINKYTEILKNLVLATSLRGGLIGLYGDTKDVPISERFFLGGRETVRGYAQNTLGPKNNNQPTGGNAFLIGNIEMRYSIGKNFFLVNFLDFGNVWKKLGEVKVTDLKYTAGLGLRYKTPIGPIRIDYGHKLNRERNESNGEIHFSIGHAF
jgi:outer membrane protein insertion porin family